MRSVQRFYTIHVNHKRCIAILCILCSSSKKGYNIIHAHYKEIYHNSIHDRYITQRSVLQYYTLHVHHIILGILQFNTLQVHHIISMLKSSYIAGSLL